MNAPELTPCPQCGSLYCGPIRCRFHGTDHPKPAPLVEPCLYYRQECDCHGRGLCLAVA